MTTTSSSPALQTALIMLISIQFPSSLQATEMVLSVPLRLLSTVSGAPNPTVYLRRLSRLPVVLEGTIRAGTAQHFDGRAMLRRRNILGLLRVCVKLSFSWISVILRDLRQLNLILPADAFKYPIQ